MIIVTVPENLGKYADVGNETTDTSVIQDSETSPTPTDAFGQKPQADTVQHTTRHFFNALSRQSPNPTRVAMLLIALVGMVAVLGVAPGAMAGPATIVDPAAPTSIGDSTDIDFGTERIAESAPTTTTALVRTSGPAVLIRDPRTGDLRLDPEADTLPGSYVAAPAAEIIRDISYGPDEIHLLDLYLPESAGNAQQLPVVVFLHSGGWIGGDRTFVPDMIMRFLERGYAVAAVEYSLAPDHPFPAPIVDVKRAIRELKAIGDDTGVIDGDSIVLYGTSAGGHIAAFVAATVGQFEPEELSANQAAKDSSVAGIVVAVGPTDLVEMYSHPNAWARPMSGAHAGCEPCTVEQLEAPSIGNYLHEQMPPAYWVYGEIDPLVDAELQGRTMAEAWAQAAGSEFSSFDLVEGSDHNLDETVVNQRAIEAFVDAAVGR